MRRKFLTLIVAILVISMLALVVSATCYEDYELARIDKISQKEEKYNPGGNNKQNGEIDGNLDTGIAGNWRDGAGSGVIYKYAKQHLIREINITFGAPVDGGTGLTQEGYGYKLYLSSDSGVTWQEVGSYISVVDDTKETRTYKINDGKGIQADAFKFEYTGKVLQYNVSLYEVSITGSDVVECTWDAGVQESVADCGNEGKTLHTCSVCLGTKTEIIPATGNHTWDAGVEKTPATSEVDGEMLYTCSVCQGTKIEAIPATGHNFDNGTVVPPTCLEKGYTLYKCTDDGCDKTYKADETNALGHDMDDGVITKHASVSSEGVLTYSCKRDDCTYTEEEPIPLASYEDNKVIIGSDYILSVEEILANEDKASDKRDPLGILDGKTSGSGQSATAAAGGWFAPSGSTLTITFREEIHVLSANIYAWSNWNNVKIEFFDANGNVVASYSNGGFSVTDGSVTPVSNIGGKLVKSLKISSISAKGEDGSCLVIHEIQIQAHEHQTEQDKAQYDEQGATCSEYGSYKKLCYVCDKEFVVQTAKTTHNYTEFVEQITPPTCIASGKDLYKCATCDDKSEKDSAPTGVHSYTVFVTYVNEPNCASDGSAIYKCETCEDVTEKTVTSTGDHAYNVLLQTITEPTCENVGRGLFKCSGCDAQLEKDIPALGEHLHTILQETITKPSCTDPGLGKYKCERCDDTVEKEIGITFHTTDYACKDADGKCNVCNADVTVEGHSWSSDCDMYCNECEEERTTTADHKTDFACYDADNKCNRCDEPIRANAKHKTDKACYDVDGKCNVCSQDVTLAEHEWTGECDTDCGVCGTTRTDVPAHILDYACKDADGNCNVCSTIVTLASHTYSADCDAMCNVCFDERSDAKAHTTDFACKDADGKCNVCSAMVTLASHTYSADCDTVCDVCGDAREAQAHTTDKACSDADGKCNVCGMDVTLAAHTYAFACDPVCDVCEFARADAAAHAYGEFTVVTEATKDVPGVQTRTCSVCGVVETTPVAYEAKLGAGAIVGIAAGSAVVVGAGGFSLFWFVIKKKTWADLIAVFKK